MNEGPLPDVPEDHIGHSAAHEEEITAAIGQPSFTVDRSEVDGVMVVFVDTYGMPEDERGPLIRIYLNDEVLFENPPFPQDRPGPGHGDSR